MTSKDVTFRVRWRDLEGRNRREIYSDYDAAHKDAKLLIRDGARDVDLAAIVPKVEEGEEVGMFPSHQD